MTRFTEPAAPRVSPPDLPDDLETARPRRGADLYTVRIELDGDADLSHSSLEQCVITGTAGMLELRGATLMDVDLREPRIADLPLRDANLRRVRISGGRIGTLDLSGARIDELELRDVRIDYLNLGGAKATDVLLADSTIRTLDMPQAELTRVRFDGCRSDEVDPRGLRAKDVDLRGLDALSFLDVTSLRGTTLTIRQVELLAPVFAASVGISVRD